MVLLKFEEFLSVDFHAIGLKVTVSIASHPEVSSVDRFSADYHVVRVSGCRRVLKHRRVLLPSLLSTLASGSTMLGHSFAKHQI